MYRSYDEHNQRVLKHLSDFSVHKVQIKPTSTETRFIPTSLPPLSVSKCRFDGTHTTLSDAIVRLRTPEKRNRSPRKVKIILPKTEETEMTLPPTLTASRCDSTVHHDPTPTYWNHLHKRCKDKLEKQTSKLIKANERQQLPLSTILVRWIYSPCQQPFTLDSIWYVMSRFGYITHLQYISPSSAIVVYENITAACNAITTKYLHTTQNRLRCHWYHKEMKNKLFRSTGSRLKVVTDKFI